jgi:hypothetical protein
MFYLICLMTIAVKTNQFECLISGILRPLIKSHSIIGVSPIEYNIMANRDTKGW